MDATIRALLAGHVASLRTLSAAVAQTTRPLDDAPRAVLVTLTDDDEARASLVRAALRRVEPLAPHVADMRGWLRHGSNVLEDCAPLPPGAVPLRHVAQQLRPTELAALLLETLFALETGFWCAGFVHGALTPDTLLVVSAGAGADLPWRYERGTTGAGADRVFGPLAFELPAAAHRGRRVLLAGDLRRARAWLTAPGALPLLVAPPDSALRPVDASRDVRTLALALLADVLDLDATDAALPADDALERARFVHLVSLLGEMAALGHALPHVRDALAGHAAAEAALTDAVNASFAAGHTRTQAYYAAARRFNALVQHELAGADRGLVVAAAAETAYYPMQRAEREYAHTPSACLNHLLFVPWAASLDEGRAVLAASVPRESVLPDPWRMSVAVAPAPAARPKLRELAPWRTDWPAATVQQ